MNPVHCKKTAPAASTPRKRKGPSHTKHTSTVEAVVDPGEIHVTLKSVVNTINSCVTDKHVAFVSLVLCNHRIIRGLPCLVHGLCAQNLATTER
jgi:hypothetical protein